MKSVHLADFPDPSQLPYDEKLVKEMDYVREICTTALSIRNTENIRIRQPLQRLVIIAKNGERLTPYFDLIGDELNVKEVALENDIEKFADYKIELNFPLLGKRLPDKIKQIIPASKKGEWKKLPDGRIEITGEILEAEECSLKLEPKNRKGAQSLPSNDAIVVLDVAITEELKKEGVARDIVRIIQQARKDAGLNITDHITLNIEANGMIKDSIESYESYIMGETLADFLNFTNDKSEYITEQPLEDDKIRIGITKR